MPQLKAKELHNSLMCLLEEAERCAWDDQNRLLNAQERVIELEQLADPNHDGYPYSDTTRT
jgi:hypothetical protein